MIMVLEMLIVKTKVYRGPYKKDVIIRRFCSEWGISAHFSVKYDSLIGNLSTPLLIDVNRWS